MVWGFGFCLGLQGLGSWALLSSTYHEASPAWDPKRSVVLLEPGVGVLELKPSVFHLQFNPEIRISFTPRIARCI